MSGRYYEAANDTNMYNLSSDTSRSSPLGSPNPPRSTAVKREGFHESYSAPSLGRDTPKGNAEEGNKREVGISCFHQSFLFNERFRAERHFEFLV